MVSSALASRTLTPSGRRRFTLATKMLLRSHFVEPRGSCRSLQSAKRNVGFFS